LLNFFLINTSVCNRNIDEEVIDNEQYGGMAALIKIYYAGRNLFDHPSNIRD
jgi:hypothetical protein